MVWSYPNYSKNNFLNIEGPSVLLVQKNLGLPNIHKVKVEKYQESGRASELTQIVH